MDAIFEVSSGPTEAVSALAGMFPPEAAPADEGSPTSSTGAHGADQPAASTTQEAAAATTAATAPEDAMLLANKRQAKTMGDIQVQRGPAPAPAAEAPATPPAEEDEAECSDAVAGSDAETGPSPDGVDDSISSSSSSDDAELEKVAAFIASYAGADFGGLDPRAMYA